MFRFHNPENVSEPVSFVEKTKELGVQLSHNASVAEKMYGSGEMEADKSVKFYGLAQCTRDLPRGDCKKCLEDAVDSITSCCNGKKGTRLFSASCFLRYEQYQFLNDYYSE